MNTAPSAKVPPHRVRPEFILGVVPLALFCMSCAGQVYPAGGPPDTVPPRIIRTLPDSNATRVHTSMIELEFSKYVDRRSVEESIFISPFVGELEFDWSGRVVGVSFAGQLRLNTTYVVNVGTDVKDQRAGNRMAAGYTLAFSTGDSIDQGFITGRVYDDKPEGVMIFAYALDGIHPDTLNPARAKPDYIMQTGKAGLWTLSNLAFGSYRLYAVRDEYKNLVYDKGIDAYGVPDGDVRLDSGTPRITDVNFRLTKEDTVKPFLTSVRTIDRYRLQVKFSEPLDTLSFERAKFIVTDTVTGKRIPNELSWLLRSTTSTAGVQLALPLDSASMYRLRVQDVTDPAGNPIDTGHATFDFRGTNRPDTARPSFALAGMRDSVRGVWIENPIEIDFTKPVLHEPMATAVILEDSSRKVLALDPRWLNATDLIVRPRGDFLSAAWYRIRIVMDSVRDYFGQKPKDSTFVLRFRTVDLKTTGVIAGSLADVQGDNSAGPIYLTASSIDITPQQKRTVLMTSPGPFILNRLVEGKYVLEAYRDRDSSANYSFGTVFPFSPSERFAVYPDTIKVRARWNVEGVRIVIPQLHGGLIR